MDEAQDQLHSCWINVEGLRIHARVSTSAAPGDRTPVVLVHGFVVSSRYLIPTGNLLAKDFHVYAPDFPGFGLSDKPSGYDTIEQMAEWLIKYLDAAGLERPAVLANSMGCQVVVEAATRYPGRLRNIVLSAPVIDRHARNTLIQIWRTVSMYPQESPPLITIHLRDYASAGLRRVVRSLQAMMAYPIEEKLPHIHDPVLVVRGQHDALVPQSWAEEVTALLPRGRLVVIPGGGHTTNYSTPLELTRVTRPFLARAD